MRNNDQYIEHALKSKLYAELEYIKEKRKIEEEAKLVLGNEYSKKIQEITDARNHAYLSGQCFIADSKHINNPKF